MNIGRKLSLAFGVFLFAGLQFGCGKPSPASLVHARLNRLGLLYCLYAGSHEGQPPRDFAAFRGFVDQRTRPADLENLNALDLEDLLRSPRDNKPYGFVALSKMPSPTAEVETMVLYEEDGVEGIRAVAFLGGGTAEMNADKFAQAMSNTSEGFN